MSDAAYTFIVRWVLTTLNAYSGLVQACAAVIVAVLTFLLIRWNKKYVRITEQMMNVAVTQADAALQQTSILKEQWDHAKEARLVLRVPLWANNPLSLEIVNVGEPTIVVRRILVDVPVTTHSTSAINIDLTPSLVLPKNAVQQIDLDSGIRDFVRLRQIPEQTFQSLAEVMVLGESWDKTIAEGMWVLVQMRNGRIRTSVGSVNLTPGCDLEAFELYKQRACTHAAFPGRPLNTRNDRRGWLKILSTSREKSAAVLFVREREIFHFRKFAVHVEKTAAEGGGQSPGNIFAPHPVIVSCVFSRLRAAQVTFSSVHTHLILSACAR